MDFLFALVSWQLWKERNAHCFREASSSLADLLQIIKAEADNWIQAGATAF
jgi:predicted negative regulator of RcsB-dependent stress response